jgi:uncharacterized protein (TIGR03000 family)
MFRRTAVRIVMPALAGIGLLLVAGTARAQQGWPINGSNWSYYGTSGGSSSYAPSAYSGPAATPEGYSYAAPSADYYDGAYANRPLAPNNYSYGAYSPSAENVASIRLAVPADARVWFDNKATNQRGQTRDFQSPPLAPGRQYVYDVKVSWRDKDGKEITRTRQLSLSANSAVSADFTRP